MLRLSFRDPFALQFLSDMAPNFPSGDFSDRHRMQREPLRELQQGVSHCAQSANFTQVLFVHFGSIVSRATQALLHGGALDPISSRLTSLADHAGHIVGMCAGEQMRRVNTERVIAGVTNYRCLVERAVVKKERKAMRAPDFAFKADLSIAVRSDGALPQPAFEKARSFSLTPKFRRRIGPCAFSFRIHVGLIVPPKRDFGKRRGAFG